MQTLQVEEGAAGVSPASEPRPVPSIPKAGELPGAQRGQFGEVAALCELLDHYGAANHWAVDVGAHDGVLFSNTAALRAAGWSVVAVERNHEQAERCRELSPSFYCTIEATARADGPHRLDNLIEGVGGVPLDLDVLSIDVDGADYHLWDSLKEFKPRIVVIEVADAGGPYAEGEYILPAGEDPALSPTPPGAPANWEPFLKVTTLLSMSLLARAKGYRLAGATRCNAVFVRQDVVDSKPLKLNLGGAGTYLCGFINVDALCGDRVFPLKEYADGSVEEIRASHILEHFSHRQTLEVLREWMRVLRPGGKIKVAVPDFDKCIDPKTVPNFGERQMYIFGGHTDRFDRHGAHFTEQSLTAQLHHVGVEWVERWASTIPDCASYPISLNLMGVKRGFVRKDPPRVCAVVSQPRLTFATTMKDLHRALRTIQTRYSVGLKEYTPVVDDLIDCGGAYWEKFITSGIKKALTLGADYLLFCDYDSAFTPEDVTGLVEYLQENLSASAAFAVQASRHHDQALVEMPFLNYEGEKTRVQLAHFGLAVVRAEVFHYLPKPWLWSMPNPTTGDWDTQGHCDADITFWRVLAEYGHQVHQLNRIQAGHIIQCVKWLTPKGAIYQPIEHYEANGRPKEVLFAGSPEKVRARPVSQDATVDPSANGHVEASLLAPPVGGAP